MIPACFICGSEGICFHREPELIPYWRRIEAEFRADQMRELDRRPPMREWLRIQAQKETA